MASVDRALVLRIVDIVLLSLAAVTTLLRCYTRVFVVKGMGVDDWLMVVAMVVFGIVFLGSAIGQCTPVSYFWNKDQGGWCINSKVVVAGLYLYSTSSLFSDATFALFPIFLTRGLQMDRRTRLGLIPILGMGWIASIAVLVRFPFLQALTSDDLTYDGLPIAIVSSFEQGLAIAAGNLATLRPLFTRTLNHGTSKVTPISNERFPPTIGAIEREIIRDSTGLVILPNRRDEEQGFPGVSNDDTSPKGSTMFLETKISIKRSNLRNSWFAALPDCNESEENLRTKPSVDSLFGNAVRASPTSFLAKPDRSEN
ncbi:hypothetical protein BX600DRAFT_502665 [Xylariales sp. PMI_506]|nr:hypothetical protein BX600DRAFT_502665 [Xylariales sp. PMI_506]